MPKVMLKRLLPTFIILFIILTSSTTHALFTPTQNTPTSSSNEQLNPTSDTPETQNPTSTSTFPSLPEIDTSTTTDDTINPTAKHLASSSTNENSSELIIGIDNTHPTAHSDLTDLLNKYQGKVVNTISANGKPIALVTTVPPAKSYTFQQAVKTSGLARYIEPNKKYQTQFTPNDPYWTQQWAPTKIQADYAWNTTQGNHTILVAVIDTGIDYTHPDLTANYVPLGYDWVNNDNNPIDDNGHGTHCAGIIAAQTNNTIGIAGLAQVRIMAEKGLNSIGNGYDDDLANAIIHAVDQGANILSNSWGGTESSELLHDAIKYAYNHGVLIVAAAGNAASTYKHYPAAYDEVIAVTATTSFDLPAPFTSFGDWAELGAPGVSILSTMPGNYYDLKGGTSMACPHVAGLAALIWSQFPKASRDWIRAQLRFTADDLGEPGFDVYYGYGRINAKKAVEQVPPEHDLAIFDWKKPKYIQPEDTAQFNVTILNYGTSDEQNVTIQLLINGNLTDSNTVNYLANGTLTETKLPWTPSTEGTFNVTLFMIPVLDENITENNVISKMIMVKSLIGNVAFEEAHTPLYSIGDNPALDVISGYSEFANNLINSGYNVSTINPGTTIDQSILATIDILVIVAPQKGYLPSELHALESWVKEGGNLLLISDWGTYGAKARSIAANFNVNLRGDMICDSNENCNNVCWPYYDDGKLLNHPITVNISRVEMYGGDGIISGPQDQNPVIVTDSDRTSYWSNDNSSAIRVPVMSVLDRGTAGYGRLAVIGDSNIWDSAYDVDEDGEIDFYDSNNSALAMNTINWFRINYPHELSVSVKAPEFLKPSDSAELNATVYNFGQQNETNVELQLLINGTLANNVTIPQLSNGTSYTINFSWTPTLESTFNITVYAPPLSMENVTINNMLTQFVHVQYPLINPIEGDYSNYKVCDYDGSGNLLGIGYMNFSYDHYVEPYKILINYSFKDPSGYLGSDTMIVNTMTRLVEEGAMATWWFPAWIQTNTGIGSTVNILDGTVTVTNSTCVLMNVRVIDCWEMQYQAYGFQYTFLHDKMSGVWIKTNSTNTYTANYETVELADTNIPIGSQYEHDLGVFLEIPSHVDFGKTIMLNATVYNLGIGSETAVQLMLFLNGSLAANANVPYLATGATYTLAYAWKPTICGNYNASVYALSILGESVIINNVYSGFVLVRHAPHILAYVQYADYYNEYANTLKAIESAFGTDYVLTELWDFHQLSSMTSGIDILLIPEQEQTNLASLESVGRYWCETLNDFLEKGGILVVCDNNGGLGGSYGVLTGAGLMSIAYGFSRTYFTLYVVDSNDVLAKGLPSSFTAPYNTLAFETSEKTVVINDGSAPVVIHKKIGLGNIFLLGFDFDELADTSSRIIGNAISLGVHFPVFTRPNGGSVGTQVTVSGMEATSNGTVSIYWDTTFVGNVTANSAGNFTYFLTVPSNASEGIHEIAALDASTERVSVQDFRVMMITLGPSEGPVGAKATVEGKGFLPETQAAITFNDVLIGYASVDSLGRFSFTFNVPLSNPESQTVKAIDAEGNWVSADFTVIDLTPLGIQIEAETAYLFGDVAEFFVQTSFKDQIVDATIDSVVVYTPNGNIEHLSAQKVATGVYRVIYSTSLWNETGTYTLAVTASYNTTTIKSAGTSFSNFAVESATAQVDTTPLDVKIDVGALYFIGEAAEFYIQTTFKGQTVNSMVNVAVLYKPDGGTENVTVQQVATGLYRILYTVVDSETGTFTLVVTASYETSTIQSVGSSFRSFLVSDTLNKQVVQIKDGLAIVQTESGLISINLTALNATLESIFLNVIAINGSTATMQTTLGIMNGTITDMHDHVATILVPGIGQIQTDVSNFIEEQKVGVIVQYAILIFALLAAAGSSASLFIMLRRKRTKPSESSVAPLTQGQQ
jgi:thermitase